jgi:hypothetical protein
MDNSDGLGVNSLDMRQMKAIFNEIKGNLTKSTSLDAMEQLEFIHDAQFCQK